MLSEKFIKANNELCDFDHYVNAPYFRKEFSLDFVPETAEITICGLGFYELYINGTDVTKGPLAPYISNPDNICCYDSYNISCHLNKGKNAIGIVLGNGFRNCYGGFVWDFDKANCRGPVTFAMHFIARDEKNIIEFEADKAFKTHPSPIVYNDLRMGYCYDSNLECDGWNKPGFDDSNWEYAICEKTPPGIKRLCNAEPIVITGELTAKSITYYKSLPYAHTRCDESKAPFKECIRNDVYVYDFGFNTAGVTKLKINGRPGQKITVRHGENLVDGNFSVNNIVIERENERHNQIYRDMQQTDIFICKGGEEEFIPKFKYDGFRYAYVEGLSKEQATPEALTCLVMNSDIKQRSSFECSDDTLNALQQCTLNSDLANFYYFPTDCPHREKNGWTADAWLSAEHMLMNFTAENSLREWMTSVRYAQRTDGALPGIVPTGGWGFKWGNGPVWDSVCVQIPYYIYRFTQNTDVINENSSLIMRYLHYVSSMRDDRGLTGFGLGDWCDPFQPITGYYASPLDVTASMAILDISKKAAFLFEKANLKKEAAYASSLAEEMLRSIREHLIDFKTMTVLGNCQTSQALGLEIGVFDDTEKPIAQKRLVDIIHRDGDINTCGAYGSRYIYHALADMGEANLAYKLITCKERSCYGYWIENGATTLWESFKEADIYHLDSMNHHFFGDISSWFIQKVAGLRPNPNADDINYFEISPNIISALRYAEASFDTQSGMVYVKWEKTDSKTTLTVKAPEGTYGKILPGTPDEYVWKNGTDIKIEL